MFYVLAFIVLLTLLLFYLVASKGAVCFLFVMVHQPSPLVHSGKSRLSATAWWTICWPHVCSTSRAVWSAAHGNCIAEFS